MSLGGDPVLDALADDPSDDDDPATVDVVPSPSVADVDACRYASWHAIERLRARAFKSVSIPLPPEYVEYLLEDGLALAADDEALPARVTPSVDERLDTAFAPEDEVVEDASTAHPEDRDAVAAAGDETFDALRRRFGVTGGDEDDEDDERASEASERASDASEASAGPPPRAVVPRRFPALERTVRDAIDRLGGFVAPKLTWSSPKDATWMATRKSMKCANPGEVTLLLKASDAIAHDLCDAYACCADRGALSPEAERARLRGDAELHLLAWRELNPSMEFRCFVRRGTLRGVCQRDCSNFYPFLPDRVDRLTDLLAEFWQDVVYPSFPSDFSYCFDAYVTSAEKVRIVDVNPWGGATLPLMFDWSEFDDGARGGSEGAEGASDEPERPGFADDVDFRVVTARGHVRPAPALGVPFDMVDRSPDGALAAFAAAQREREEEERRRRDDDRGERGA
jgi:hypothetical protein